jgi:hypothetical protein
MRNTGARVVPWLQDFTLGVDYGPREVRAQIDAARRAGVRKFLLWDPLVTYTSPALTPNARTFADGLAQANASAPASHTQSRHATTPTPRRAMNGRKPDELA